MAETKLQHAESIDVDVLTFLDRSDLTGDERFIAEQIYDLSSKLVDKIENPEGEDEG